jgi:hypothetical protein
LNLSDITRLCNVYLAGERLEYIELEPFLDISVDTLNTKLNTAYPAFTDFTPENYPSFYPDYAFLPSEYIRSCVVLGAVCLFYRMDEEGLGQAFTYEQQWQENLFTLLRDYGSTAAEGPFSKHNFDQNAVIGSLKLHEDGMHGNNGKWQQPVPVNFRDIGFGLAGMHDDFAGVPVRARRGRR